MVSHGVGILDVVESQLCSGCGVCVYLAPDVFRMSDVLDEGLRPILIDGASDRSGSAEAAFRACPGFRLNEGGRDGRDDERALADLAADWGPVFEIWEGHAADAEVRFAGSSGGVITALASYCVERGGFDGVVHTAACPDRPYASHTVLSKTRAELLAGSGSRYAPSSPCDGLGWIEESSGPCVFIGKPCDVAGARNACRVRPVLARNLGLTLSIFCGGTPSTRGTLEFLRRLGVDFEDVGELRYRGHGWPGMAGVSIKGDSDRRIEMSYREAWDEILTRYRPFRCHICPDGTGEFADLACGDPWYRPIQEGEQGSSLIVVRTEAGRRVLHAALEAGFIVAERRGPEVLAGSQSGLLNRRRHVFPKVLALRLLGLAHPEFRGFHLWRGWLRLPKRRVVVSLYRALRYAWSVRRKSRSRTGVAGA